MGESKARKSNVRIIAATNKNLLEESKQKRFRSDLYYRLSVFPIEVPPLRERLEDIPKLLDYFVAKICSKYKIAKPNINPEEINILCRQRWPGNVRELQNEIERAVIHSQGQQLAFIPHQSMDDVVEQNLSVTTQSSIKLTLNDLVKLEKDIIQNELERTKGKIYGVDGAAAALGIPPTTLNYRIKKLGIQK